MREELERLLEKQGYGFAGDHGGVKLCHWTKEDLKEGGRSCYKGSFYGVESHRCMQMTPVVDYCNFRCLYCWRSQDFDTSPNGRVWDDPEELFEDSVNEQQRLMSGYKGQDVTDMEKWVKANRPKHVAISLNGEPTVYPYLADFIEMCHDHDMTTMVVTNGSFPDQIRTLAEEDALPTQLYVSVDAPNEGIFNELCVPMNGGAWYKLNETLELVSDLDCRTVARHTLVKDWNMGHYDEYADLIEKADPDFIECKGYVYVGYSRQRMKEENMPTYSEIRQHANRLAERIPHTYEADREDSRVSLLVHPDAERRIPKAADEELDPIDVTDDVSVGVNENGAGGCGTACGCASM
jgi:tRNA wybutosine-synthesizing protein 1